jgi:hypothetical protein
VPATVSVGKLAMVIRPRANKLLTRNSGPYLVVSIGEHTVTLQNLANGSIFVEHRSNVAPLMMFNENQVACAVDAGTAS